MPRTTTRPQAHACERGFTTLELIVGLLIVAILAAISITAFSGSKKATYALEGKSVGSAYMQAVSQYHADFANRHPPTTGPAALKWSGNNTAAAKRGPLNLLGQPYLKSAPDAVSIGRVGISVNTNCGAPGTPSGASTQTAWVSVCYLAAPRLWIRVIARKNSSAAWNGAGASACYMGAPASTPAYPAC